MAKIIKEQQYLTVGERYIAGIISVIFLALSVYLVISPPIRQTIVIKDSEIQTTNAYSDQSTVVVFLMAVGSIFVFYAINGLRLKKFSAGPISGESESGQGVSPPVEPSSKSINASKSGDVDYDTEFESLTNDEKKVLKTLWRYQKLNFPNNYNNRWTFKIFANNPEYPAYLTAVSTLLTKGYISINPENEQSLLTNEGIILMDSIGEKAKKGDYYVF